MQNRKPCAYLQTVYARVWIQLWVEGIWQFCQCWCFMSVPYW